MSTAASIALIFLIIQALIVALIPLAINAGMVFAMIKLRGLLKRVLPKAQGITARVAETAHDLSDKVAAPFITANAVAVEVRTVVKGARNRLSKT